MNVKAAFLVTAIVLVKATPAMALQHLTRGGSADLQIQGEVAALELEHALTPGESIAAWKTLWQAAHDEGTLPPEPPTLARLRVAYVDGVGVVVNLRYGESIGLAVRDWWNPADGFITDLPFAEVLTAVPTEEGAITYAVSYRLKWENPRPGVAVKSIQYLAAAGLGSGATVRSCSAAASARMSSSSDEP